MRIASCFDGRLAETRVRVEVRVQSAWKLLTKFVCVEEEEKLQICPFLECELFPHALLE